MKHSRTVTFLTKTPLMIILAMILFLSALSYVACGEKKNNDSETALALLLAAAGGGPFPVTDGNVFSVQYRNSTSTSIIVWLEGSQPPCSQAEALNCNTTGWDATNYETKWNELRTGGYFAASDTHFFNISKKGVSTEINISNHIALQPGETLRIELPIVSGKPQWYWSNGITEATAGVKGWVTRAKDSTGVDISMPASQKTLLYEYNVSPDGKVYWDLSAVDGLNAKATMTYEGTGCGSAENCGCDNTVPKVVKTNITAYNGSNDGCPYIMQDSSGANICPNPKFYPATIDDAVTKPAWVVGTSSFTTASVESEYNAIWIDAGSPLGPVMASAPLGPEPAEITQNIKKKKAYHIWWYTNPVAQGWLNYLQNNRAGRCDAYGWALDEKKWDPNDPNNFDSAGNPPDNTLKTHVQCPILTNTYLNIDILDIM